MVGSADGDYRSGEVLCACVVRDVSAGKVIGIAGLDA